LFASNFNILYSIIFSLNKLGVGKEIKIVFSKVDHLHSELEHENIVTSIPTLL
jgi:hypothetical protein